LLLVNAAEKLALGVKLGKSSCGGSAKLTFTWATTSKPEYFFGEVDNVDTSRSQDLLIPKNRLQPGVSYTFQLTLTAEALAGGKTLKRVTKITVKVRDIPSPTLVSALFNYESGAGSIHLLFSAATNRASMSVGSACSKLLTTNTVSLIQNADVSALECSWSSARQMIVTWNGGPASFSIGSAMRTKPGVLRSADGFSSFAPPMEALLATEVVVAPLAALVAPSRISQCEGVKLNAAASSGSGGRPFTVQWELVAVEGTPTLSDVEKGKIMVLLPADSPSLQAEIPSSALLSGYVYRFKVTLTNWLGNMDAAETSVNKEAGNLPKISIAGVWSAFTSTERSKEVRFDITVSGSPCASGGDAESNELTTVWRRKGVAMDAWTGAWTLPQVPSLVIPPNTLVPGKTYSFELTVTNAAGSDNSQTFSIGVDVVPTPKFEAAGFEDTMTGIIVDFTSATNTPGPGFGSAFPCAQLWDAVTVALLGTEPTCSWISPKKLRISLGSEYTVVAGSLLVLLADVVYSLDGYSAPLSAASVAVQAPNNPPVPFHVVQGNVTSTTHSDNLTIAMLT
jgi:hypothetical protein